MNRTGPLPSGSSQSGRGRETVCVLHPLLCAEQCAEPFTLNQLLASSSQLYGGEVTAILRMRPLSLREAEYLMHKYIVSGWQSKDWHSGLFGSLSVHFQMSHTSKSEWARWETQMQFWGKCSPCWWGRQGRLTKEGATALGYKDQISRQRGPSQTERVCLCDGSHNSTTLVMSHHIFDTNKLPLEAVRAEIGLCIKQIWRWTFSSPFTSCVDHGQDNQSFQALVASSAKWTYEWYLYLIGLL